MAVGRTGMADTQITRIPIAIAVAKGLCGVGCVAPHFNETRGEERARGLNVPIKIKEQI
jgi:hypothetical protein